MSADNDIPPSVGDHAFEAEPWWEKCAHCGMGMAAHDTIANEVRIARDLALREHDYRCPFCVDRGHAFCEHGPRLALGIDAKPLYREVAHA